MASITTNYLKGILNKPYWIIDILPEQVPGDSAGQYFAIEEYYLEEPRTSQIRRKYADVILKLNCYCDIAILEQEDLERENIETARKNPDPRKLSGLFTGPSALDYFAILVGNEDALITSNKDDTYMTIYEPSERALGLIRSLAAAEGLFVWRPSAQQGKRI